MNFILTKSVYSKNWTKTLKSVIMNDTGPHLGKSQNLKSSSELTYRMYKLCKFLLVCTYQNYYDENIWSCQRRKYKINKDLKGQKYDYFVHQPFHNLVRVFPGLFWGQPIDSAGGGGGLAVFGYEINNLATQSWKEILAFVP